MMVEWNKLVTQIDGPHLPKAFTLWSRLSQFAWIVPLFSLNIACSWNKGLKTKLKRYLQRYFYQRMKVLIQEYQHYIAALAHVVSILIFHRLVQKIFINKRWKSIWEHALLQLFSTNWQLWTWEMNLTCIKMKKKQYLFHVSLKSVSMTLCKTSHYQWPWPFVMSR